MKKTFVPVVLLLIVAVLFTSMPAMAWTHTRGPGWGGPGPGPGWGGPRPGWHGPGPGWRGGPRYVYRGSSAGSLVGGMIIGGLIAGTMVAATRPPVQVVQQPVFVGAQPMVVQQPVVLQQPVVVQQQPVVVQQPMTVQQPMPRMCTEDRRVTGEYQYDAGGNAVWVEFAHPVMRTFQVPCQ